MDKLLITIAGPTILIVLSLVMVFRLRLLTAPPHEGRVLCGLGVMAVIAASLWQIVTAFHTYQEWFLPEVYPIISAAQLVCWLGGFALFVVGLVLKWDAWRRRAATTAQLYSRLSLPYNIHIEAAQPYQLLTLLEMVLKELLSQYPSSCGAVFLLNRQRRELVLSSYLGLNKNEIARLERYPYQANTITEAIEQGAPTLAGAFEFVDEQQHWERSRFESTLVLPLVSAMDRLGVVLLLAPEPRAFSSSDLQLLWPVAGWLAERVRSARLQRELTGERENLRRQSERHHDLLARLEMVGKALAATDPVDAVCRALVGAVGAEAVFFVGLTDGGIESLGGSDQLEDLSENLRAALVEALHRDRPVIINQEATDEQGHSVLASSTLVCPASGRSGTTALLLRRQSQALQVSQRDLIVVQLVAELVQMARRLDVAARSDLTRRRGFGQLLQMMRLATDFRESFSLADLVERLMTLLPKDSVVIACRRQAGNVFQAFEGVGLDRELLPTVSLELDDPWVASAVTSGEPSIIRGRGNLDRSLEKVHPAVREPLYEVFGEMGTPNCGVLCPLISDTEVDGLLLVFIRNVPDGESGEHERLTTLAAALYSFHQTLTRMQRRTTSMAVPDEFAEMAGQAANDLNNRLMAILGSAELARQQVGDPMRTGDHLDQIVIEAQKAADLVRGLLAHPIPGRVGDAGATCTDPNGLIRQMIESKHISGALFMVGTHPRELDLRLRPVPAVAISADEFRSLVMGAVEHLGSICADDETITLSSYEYGEQVYLDISRHSRDLPAVERVAGLGKYVPADQAPAGLAPFVVAGTRSYAIAVNEARGRLDFVSLRFEAVRSQGEIGKASSVTAGKILAIDDQTIILDLIAAAGQAQGFEVEICSDAQEGLRRARRGGYQTILVDLAMPGLSGTEFAAELRQTDRDVPVVLMTGWEVDVGPDRLRSLGINSVLHKPFRIEQLTNLLTSLASSRISS